MDALDFVTQKLGWLPKGVLAQIEKQARRIPAVRRMIDRQMEEMMQELRRSLKPYRGVVETQAQIPEQGWEREEVLAELESLRQKEEERWRLGYASGAVYHGDEGHIGLMNQAYAIHSQSNPLHADLWPSAAKFEAEIVAMTASMLGGETLRGTKDEVCGLVSSGGTESILLAMKAYRDWGREVKGIRRAQVVAPVTAHAAFDKAAQYFDIHLVKVEVGADFRADVRRMEKAITRNTVALVGSAPSFPHGTIDPIEELSEIARRLGIGFHTDACLGGFLLPWAERLGYPVPGFDFRLPGVTSISVDTHKYGYAAKGTSVLLFRGKELRHHAFFAVGDWPGGLYCSPTFAGSRPGALSAACWAALVSTGQQGYLEGARKILQTADWIKQRIRENPDLRLLGEPLWVLAFTSDTVDIYRVLDAMGKRGWSLNGLFSPPAVHLCVTLRHTQPGVAERFINDLKAAIAEVKQNPSAEGGLAPIYGLASGIPFRGLVEEMLKGYLDVLYEVE